MTMSKDTENSNNLKDLKVSIIEFPLLTTRK